MADDTKIPIDMDPNKVIAAMKEIADEGRTLATKVEDSLGKNVPKSIGKMEEAAERGTTRISTLFRNLGTRVKEDLKTAFDATGVMAGMKFGKDLGEGVKQVFEMERAFSRLNARLKLSNTELSDFKKNIGKKIAGTGQKLEDVLPGVETAAAKGGVKSPQQLAAIGEMLGKARAVTGEDTGGLSDAVVEIIRSQGKAVTDASFKATLDAIEGTRTSGAFKTAGDAAHAVQGIAGSLSPAQMKTMGLGTREMGGLASMASKGGEGGQDILKHILQTATQAGGKEKLNAIFGADLFKNGKLDVGAFQKVNKNKFGNFSEQTFSSATGAGQADLARFIDSMKTGMADFKTVVSGSDETAAQFETATDNLASGVDKFKEKTKEAGREVGESLSQLGKDLLKGNFKDIGKDVGAVGKSVHENRGTLVAAGAVTAAVGVLAGGALGRLLGKAGVPNPADIAKQGARTEIAKAEGAQPVVVVNAEDIGKAVGDNSSALGEGGRAAGALGAVGKAAGAVAAVGAAAYAGNAIGQALMENNVLGVADIGSNAYDKFGGDNAKMSGAEASQMERNRQKFNSANQMSLTPEQFAEAVAKGTLKALKEHKGQEKVQYTQPSRVKGQH